ncbi:hypothetical protein EC973_007066 [Apophysomyces ossiformis]|uniref:C2H2-type domain-containing protein n=1 Tax=Apophysomyces ossiformis TaxID=679940 RepID=A0A8H7BT21_9FUNG|nr:hypothetical protein EC973_007066 [Apophysomyces ossiformis]
MSYANLLHFLYFDSEVPVQDDIQQQYQHQQQQISMPILSVHPSPSLYPTTHQTYPVWDLPQQQPYCSSYLGPPFPFWTTPPPPPGSVSAMPGTLIGNLEDTVLDDLLLKDPVTFPGQIDIDPHHALLFEPMAPTSNTKTTIPKKKDAEKQYRCPVCSHRSKRRHNLIEHMQTHNPNRIRKFACRHCQRSFARKYDMKRHEKIHTRHL